MSAVDASSFCRVLVIAPSTRVDVALPSDIPLVELLPNLLDMVGERSEDGGAMHDGWYLSRANGQELDIARPIQALDIPDGSALRLTPRQPVHSAPIYDDVVDAIATQARRSLDERSIVAGGGAAVAAVMGLLTGLVAQSLPRSLLTMVTGVALTLMFAGAARTICHQLGRRGVGTAVGFVGTAQAVMAGLTLVPGPRGVDSILLASVLGVAYVVLCLALLRTGLRYFMGVIIVGIFTGIAALAMQWTMAAAYQVAAGISVGAIALLANVPWIALRLARLPLPFIPTTQADLRSPELNHDFSQVLTRAGIALEYQDAAMVSCAAVAGLSAGYVAGEGTKVGLGFGLLVLAVMMLRIRSLSHLAHRVGLVTTAMAGCVVAVVRLITLHAPILSTWLMPVLLMIAVLAFVILVVVPRQRALNPVLSRVLDITDSLALGALIPMAAWVMNLYSYVRHW